MNTALENAFQNVQTQIGYCGIWCGSCIVGNGVLRELTKRYDALIRAYGLETWAPTDFDHAEFSKALASIQRTPLCPGCRKGGGREDCEMRSCASNKGLTDCCQCSEPSHCEHRGILEHMRSGALAAGLFVKTADVAPRTLLQDWMAQLKSRWPCCMLFMNDRQTP